MRGRIDKNSPIIRISAHQYIHVTDLNKNVVYLYTGPRTYVRQQNETLVVGPKDMIKLTPQQYCIIVNPVIKSKSGEVVLDEVGQVKVRSGDEEYRFYQDPFPLYPGEVLKDDVQLMSVVPVDTALRLQCLMNFDDNGVDRIAGDEWYFEGPGIYHPRKEVKFVRTETAQEISPHSALCLTATRNCVDRDGNTRVHGEKWLVQTPGLYLPRPYERVLELRYAHKLSQKCALRMRAKTTHEDVFGIQRKIGDEWLITVKDTHSHICSVHEELVEHVYLTILNKHEYCVLMDPIDENGVPQLGKLKLIRGETSFFLRPGERLRNDVEKSYVLKFDEGLILRAEDRFEDEVLVNQDTPSQKESGSEKRKVIREAGDQWLIRGPMEYIPPIEVSVVGHRTLIPLNLNEGIYVRNMNSGLVRAVVGHAYMLDQNEELWVKKLPTDVTQLILENREQSDDTDEPQQGELDLTHVVTFRVPHNSVIQIYDYKEKKARVEFGPTLVMLSPDEQFTFLNLSGGVPKLPNVLKSLCLRLGPDFFRDRITVDTADHARLYLDLAYNWHFELQKPYTQEAGAKLFYVPDFVGDACKVIASRVRGAVSSVTFDDFHKHSAHHIQKSIFGLNDVGQVNEQLVLPQNNLHITNVDIRSVEPVDQRTREALQKSVQLAIEISTNCQEAAARREAERIDQEARALLKAQTMSVETNAELERLKKIRAATLDYLNEKTTLKLKARTEEINLDVSRFKTMVSAIGADTIRAIATASSDHNLQMLSALGLQSTLITDGTTPVNLLSTAHGLIGQFTNPEPYYRVPPKKARLSTQPKQSGSVVPAVAIALEPDKDDDAEDDDDLSSPTDT